MDEKLRNDLILLAVTLVLGAIAWFVKDMHEDVKQLLLASGNTVSKEQHNELARSLREAHNALDKKISILEDRMERKP